MPGTSVQSNQGRISWGVFVFQIDVHSQVVNALLTQIDKLKTRPNVLIMTTSNLTEAIGESEIADAGKSCFLDIDTLSIRLQNY